MPVMNGLSTLQEVKRLYHMIKIIILSMDSTSPDIQEALNMGADGYLLKTSDPDLICKTIRDSFGPVAVNEGEALEVSRKL
jgi:two-component system nitrate/nitrite response regulator NarL